MCRLLGKDDLGRCLFVPHVCELTDVGMPQLETCEFTCRADAYAKAQAADAKAGTQDAQDCVVIACERLRDCYDADTRTVRWESLGREDIALLQEAGPEAIAAALSCGHQVAEQNLGRNQRTQFYTNGYYRIHPAICIGC